MKEISVIIIEDEIPAQELILAYLKEHENIRVIEICNDGFSGLKAIQKHQPDLIFLDIQMPKLNGFEMLELIDDRPAIIFTTAYDEFAIRAFEMNAVDYLLKPFSSERFDDALNKVQIRMQIEKHETSKSLKKPSEEFLPEGFSIERIVVKQKSNIVVIPVSKIAYIEAYDDYVFICSEGKRFLKQKTMKFYEEHLNPGKFIRIHRSWIVNIDFISQIMLWEKDTYMVKLKSGEELRASRAGYKRLKEIF